MADEATPAPEANPAAVPIDAGAPQRVQFQGEETGAEAPVVAAEPVLPEGFDSWEAYGKAQAGKAATEEAPKEEAATERPAEVQQAIDALPEASREKATPFFEEFAKDGDLSAESRKAAAELFGVSEEMVGLYVKGAQADAAAAQEVVLSPLYEAAGGKETYDKFAEWAAGGGYSPEQIAAFDVALDGKDGPAAVAKAVDEWKADGHGPAPRDVTRTTGHSEPQSQVQGYRSQAEMTAAMSDPKYRTDPAYRADVETKVAHSTF